MRVTRCCRRVLIGKQGPCHRSWWNWIADEVLYQAGVDPRRRASSLTDAELRRVRERIRSVVATAVRNDSDSNRFPRRWLFHDRWGKKALAKDQLV